MKYKAVIFDLFGTLVDNFSVSGYQTELRKMSAVLNAPVEGFSKMWRDLFTERVNGSHPTHQISIRYICEKLGVKVTEEQVEKASDIRLDFTVRSLKPRADAVPTIKKLKQMGYKIGLVSDCSPEAPLAWPKTAFRSVFDVTIFSCVVKMKKPDPRIFLMAAEQLGVQPNDCYYVGDGGSYELTGAAKVGMHPILIRDPKENDDTHAIDREDDWKGPAITSLKEVLEMVE
jgi:putative hydrolase of the HAD superfamily